ncbi:MAG: serine/threonine protein kinase, partial [Pirellulales bacterium]|nr:serine/threonine protein kinase [Pirellulales bacterium]
EVHAAGLLHRDIKPANIVVDNEGVPKLIDFGLASASEGSAAGHRVGTPQYMAPELARQDWDCIDHRTDLFSLGAVLYELLAGQPVYCGADKLGIMEQAKKCEVVPLKQLRPDLPNALLELTGRCLAAHPIQRPKSSAELAGALRNSIKPQRRWRAFLAVASMLIITMLAFGVERARRKNVENSEVDRPAADSRAASRSLPTSPVGLDWRQLHDLFTGAPVLDRQHEEDRELPSETVAEFWRQLSSDFDATAKQFRFEDDFGVKVVIRRNADGPTAGRKVSLDYWNAGSNSAKHTRLDFFHAEDNPNVPVEIEVSAQQDAFIAVYAITIAAQGVEASQPVAPEIDLVYPEQKHFKHATVYPAVKGVELAPTQGIDLFYVICSTDRFRLHDPNAPADADDIRGFVRGRKISQRLYRYVVR